MSSSDEVRASTDSITSAIAEVVTKREQTKASYITQKRDLYDSYHEWRRVQTYLMEAGLQDRAFDPLAVYTPPHVTIVSEREAGAAEEQTRIEELKRNLLPSANFMR